MRFIRFVAMTDIANAMIPHMRRIQNVDLLAIRVFST